jgi:hypothetical protein
MHPAASMMRTNPVASATSSALAMFQRILIKELLIRVRRVRSQGPQYVRRIARRRASARMRLPSARID